MKPLLALVLVAVAGVAQRPPQVSGVVRSAATGEGLPNAAVTLSAPGREPGSARVTTGADGAFGISGLPPGQYQITIRKPGYQVVQAAAPITIRADSSETARVTESLWPHGAIAGRVLDWEGEPVADAEVRAYAIVYQAAGANLALAARGETTDLGEYRLFDLPAGKYLLQVSPPRTATPAGQFYADAPAVYHPGVPQPAQALALELGWGQDLTRADVKLSRGPGYAIAGAAWDAAAEGPCRSCQVQAVQQDGPYRVVLPQTARVSRDGSFVLRGLSSGDYTLVARGANQAVAQTTASLRNRHSADARLALGLQRSVAGEIVLEKPPEGIDPGGWTPTLLPVALPEWWPPAEGEVGTDRRFVISEVSPARYRLEVRGLPAGAYLKAVRLGGQPLAGGELLVPPESPVSGLQAVIGFDAATLQGRVRSLENAPSVQARIFLLPAPGQAPFQSPKTAETGADGAFSLASVAPGSYTLFALPSASSLQIFDPAVQAALAKHARPVDLAPGATLNVEIPLVR